MGPTNLCGGRLVTGCTLVWGGGIALLVGAALVKSELKRLKNRVREEKKEKGNVELNLLDKHSRQEPISWCVDLHYFFFFPY